MAQATEVPTQAPDTDVDAWPWLCLGCDGPIYHDGEFCPDCRPVLPSGGGPDTQHPVAEFADWIRRETYPGFVTKITVVASLELALTALWLQLMLVGVTGFGHFPIIT